MANVKTQVALVALVIAMTGSLAACGNPIKDAVDNAVGNVVENGVEKVVENAAGEGSDIDLDLNGDGANLPDSFPDDIPRPDGKLTAAVSVGGGWQLAYAPADASDVEALVAEYESGWTLKSETDYGESKTWSFQNDDYLVIFSAIGDDDGWTISLVAAAAKE